MNDNQSRKNIKKSKKCDPKVYLYSALIFTTICAVIRSALYFLSYDKDIGYYRQDTIVLILFILFFSVFALFAVSMVFFTDVGKLPDVIRASPSVTVPSTVAAILSCMLMVTHGLVDMVRHPSLIGILYTLFSFAPFLYFLHMPNAKSGVPVICGYTIIMAFGILIFNVYSNRYIPMNNPDKTYLMFTITAFMLYFVQEFRAEFRTLKKRAYLFFSVLAIFFGFTFSSSLIISLIFGANSLTGEAYLYHALIFISFSVYVLMNLINFLRDMVTPSDRQDLPAEEDILTYTKDLLTYENDEGNDPTNISEINESYETDVGTNDNIDEKKGSQDNDEASQVANQDDEKSE